MFHHNLASASKNAILAQNYDVVQQRIWRYRFIVNEYEERCRESFAEHERIIIALKARTPLDLAERLEVHNQRTAEAMSLALC
nr:FCD domain-containing protein [Marinicella sp. W31]MDC2879253.1 FCD domain-containing protein [Marinicella sp. W31]